MTISYPQATLSVIHCCVLPSSQMIPTCSQHLTIAKLLTIPRVSSVTSSRTSGPVHHKSGAPNNYLLFGMSN
jgi:hypothetical protein